MSNTNKNQKPIDQMRLQKTFSPDFSDDDDEEVDMTYMKRFGQKPSPCNPPNDNLYKVSYPFLATLNRQHSKPQAPIATPKPFLRAAPNPISSHFSRMPQLLPIAQNKGNTILVNGQSNGGRDSLTQSRTNFSLKKNTETPLLRKSYVSAHFNDRLNFALYSLLFLPQVSPVFFPDSHNSILNQQHNYSTHAQYKNMLEGILLRDKAEYGKFETFIYSHIIIHLTRITQLC